VTREHGGWTRWNSWQPLRSPYDLSTSAWLMPCRCSTKTLSNRVLIAQAMTEDLEFVTTDGEISGYASERFRVVS